MIYVGLSAHHLGEVGLPRFFTAVRQCLAPGGVFAAYEPFLLPDEVRQTTSIASPSSRTSCGSNMTMEQRARRQRSRSRVRFSAHAWRVERSLRAVAGSEQCVYSDEDPRSHQYARLTRCCLMNILRSLLRLVLANAWPITAGELRVPGLDCRVTIRRDRHGIPMIEAQSERDAIFALGFCHAQDRAGSTRSPVTARPRHAQRNGRHEGRSGRPHRPSNRLPPRGPTAVADSQRRESHGSCKPTPTASTPGTRTA